MEVIRREGRGDYTRGWGWGYLQGDYARGLGVEHIYRGDYTWTRGGTIHGGAWVISTGGLCMEGRGDYTRGSVGDIYRGDYAWRGGGLYTGVGDTYRGTMHEGEGGLYTGVGDVCRGNYTWMGGETIHGGGAVGYLQGNYTWRGGETRLYTGVGCGSGGYHRGTIHEGEGRLYTVVGGGDTTGGTMHGGEGGLSTGWGWGWGRGLSMAFTAFQ